MNLVIALLLVGVFPAWGFGSRGLQIGDILSSRKLITMEGEEILLPTGRELTVIVFWSTWSPRSAPALKMWEQFAVDYSWQELTVISVNADHQDMTEDDIRKVTDYIAENGINLPVIIDRNLELFNEIGIIALPTAMFLDAEGKITYWLGSLPTSAKLTLKDKLDIAYGLKVEPAEKEEAEAKPVYRPANRANLYYNLARQLQKKGFAQKARARFIIALKKDPHYPDPLTALEEDFFREGRTPEAEVQLKELLVKGGLEELAVKYDLDIESSEEIKPEVEVETTSDEK
ncbi:MAG: redoxin domain-containing protein [bacterium]